VLETGLPRTDFLLDDDRDRLAEEVKRRLGVAGRRIVLYAPTYRDQLDYRSGFRLNQLRDMPAYRTELLDRGGYRLAELLDLGALGRALGDDHVLLFRKHPRVLDVLPASAESFVRDVSDYPDVTGLLAAADILVTDYSSLIFDFASTRRPIILFTPDLERYRDEIRGFSIDLENVAPGPLLRTTAEVVDALRDPEDVVAAYRERYDRFVESFCSLQDGRAAGRVVDRVFHR
jgi:CDP-glycerol glycerophosphotransferase